jgi:hypothetical protein
MKRGRHTTKPFDRGGVSLKWIRLNLGQDAYLEIRAALKATRDVSQFQRAA